MDIEQLYQVILLGVIQGIAEFLPISSSGHLVIVNEFLPGESAGGADDLALNIALHLGTLGSILVVYRKDLIHILRDFQMLISIVVATIPIVIVGFTLKDHIEAAFETPMVAACGLMVTALFLWLCDWMGKVEAEPLDQPQTPNWKQSVLIGLFQAMAIVPGISRSGSTIAGGVMVGVSRISAARFSFLIAIPAISGATLLHGIDIARGESGATSITVLVIGAIVSFFVGIGALEVLLKIVRKNRLRYFAIYCLAASWFTIAYLMFKG